MANREIIHDGHRQRLKRRFLEEDLDNFDEHQALELLLFYCINPGCCITAGYYAGKQIRQLWWLPAVFSGLFLAGAWTLFEPGESAFLTYAGIYFALGMEAMLVSRLIAGRREDNG